MPGIQVLPNGRMELDRSSKHKPKSGHKHQPDSRDLKIADLQERLEEVEKQKEQLITQYQNLKDVKREVVEDAKAIKRAAAKCEKDFEELEDKYEDLYQRFEQRGEEVKQKDKIVRQKDSEIRSKDKEIEDCRIEKRVQSGTIKQVEARNAGLQDRVTTVSDEKRRLQQEVNLRRANEETLLADNKKLKDENARLVEWLDKERQLAFDREARWRREREELERRAPPRRDFNGIFR